MPNLSKTDRHRANLLYRLRRKGIEVDTRQHTIFIPYGDEPRRYIQVRRLCREFYFSVQFVIT